MAQRSDLVTQEEAWSEAINQRGYIVLGCERQLKPGQTLESIKYERGDINFPFYVVAGTNEADMDEQSKLFDVIGFFDSWARGYEYYYRVLTD